MRAFSNKITSSLLVLTLVLMSAAHSAAQHQRDPVPAGQAMDDLMAGRFQWRVSEPLVAPIDPPEDTYYSIKDPSVVFHDGRWHLFCTIRGKNRSHQIEYLSFARWEKSDAPQRQMLKMHDGYFCAPQVFYFAPQKKWYLVCQASDGAGTTLIAYERHPKTGDVPIRIAFGVLR